MAGLRIFVSSTCYDLAAVRSQLRTFIQSQGHEPLMSDYNDILYDHRMHTHTSCVDEVATSDVVVLIVGSRFGGKSVPEALSKIDFEKLDKESRSTESLKKKENLSVTQLEILKAVESGIPVFTFIDDGVWHDHALYEKNKGKSIISEIEFPAIEKPETAAFIFEFINFLRHRTRGNSVFQFTKVQDVEDILRKQWSSLFQKLLQEQRNQAIERKRIDNLSEQFADLKTAILTSIGSTNERDVARGVVRFRRLLDLVRSFGLRDENFICKGRPTWESLLQEADIKEVIDISESPEFQMHRRHFGNRGGIYLVKEDRTYYEMRISTEFFHSLSLDWESFIELSEDTRKIIYDALSEMRIGPGPIRYIRRSIDDLIRDVNYDSQRNLLSEESTENEENS
jgi:hypothetical protein